MEHLLQILILLAGVIVCAKLAGALSVRFGQPAVLGEIVIGLILGPTVLNILHWDMFAQFDSEGAGPIHVLTNAARQSGLLHQSANSLFLEGLFADLAQIGVILLMFVAGMETDLQEMKKVGKTAFWVALGGISLPLVGGTVSSAYFGYPVYWEAIFVGTILTATSVSISAQTLMELLVLRSREGTTILGAAVIDDVLGIIVLGVVTALSAVGVAQQAETAGMGRVFLIVFRMSAFPGPASKDPGSAAPCPDSTTRRDSSRSIQPPSAGRRQSLRPEIREATQLSVVPKSAEGHNRGPPEGPFGCSSTVSSQRNCDFPSSEEFRGSNRRNSAPFGSLYPTPSKCEERNKSGKKSTPARIMHKLSTAAPQSSTLTALCFLGLLGVLHE